MKQNEKHGIRLRGVRQNNLKNLNLDIELDALTVVTGVSGSGKSSLVFDTLYAEGQRRYVETFSPYARQFLDRMDRPQVDRIEGIPPAIAIDQTNPVRSSRSTVGTMTELADYLKLLYARAATLYCRGCGQAVRRDDPSGIATLLRERVAAFGDPRLLITFTVPVPHNFQPAEVLALLERQGYTRIHARSAREIEVVQDRFRLGGIDSARLTEALEAALKIGLGRLSVRALAEGDGGEVARWRFSVDWHCADCDIHYSEATPAAFSFNSPIGACETCRGFGRVIGVDFALVVPDETKTLRGGAVKPWQTESFQECQRDLEACAKKDGIRLDVAVNRLSPEERDWLFEGAAGWVSWNKSWPGKWYGVRRFFEWLESKAYKMHIRVLLSRYRSYTPCPACQGARLKPEAQWWRVGNAESARLTLGANRRWRPQGVAWTEAQLEALPGLGLHDLNGLPIARLAGFFERLAGATGRRGGAQDAALELLLSEIRARLAYLQTVGLGYLTLDRQSRTLSGGEVQRINLTTALGTSLINTLFVLDEPSIGLHPRDVARIVEVMQRLRDAGNTLVVVEHDPQIMRAADRLLDIGPGPGERGGQIVFHGPPSGLAGAASLTAAYLRGDRSVLPPSFRRRNLEKTPRLSLRGVREHNLKALDVDLPLGGLVCLTGVSGSGKSTLIADVLFPALRKHLGHAGEVPGALASLAGAEALGEVVMVDQSPIGKTTRSNPASYVGAFDAIRVKYAALPEAKERGYTPGTFSFNSGHGRCPTCGGNGFEHVEMQFLSDVYLRCPDCNGTRYRQEVRELRYQGRSIDEVLELTVAQALAFFSGEREVAARLAPLVEVGLDYLRLGQPVPTLSGGEAQRLKLAGFLAEAATARSASKPTLFLFDEPTTGLHFEDIAKLLAAFGRLIGAGHSLIVIEHNLEVIAAADWIVDLGPEGGEGGGELVFAGPVEALLRHPRSYTAVALRESLAGTTGGGAMASDVAPRARAGFAAMGPRPQAISIHHAREHNLKNIDLELPLDRFTVITGVSGSGKSTLAFDILFAEGQRRYLESLNAYARQFVQPAGRPDVDAIHGIPPTVAIEQRVSRGGRKSTVATLTEIYHFLRLIYVKLGTQFCPECAVPIEPQTPEAIAARILAEWKGKSVQLLAPLVVSRKGLYTDLAKWAKNKGFPHLRVDGELLPTGKWPRLARFSEHNIELPVATLAVSARTEKALRAGIASALDHGKGVLQVLPVGARVAVSFSTKRACPCCGKSFPEPDPRLFSYNSKHGWCETCFGTGLAIEGFDEAQSGEEIWWNEWFEGEAQDCPDCAGKRLNATALAVRFGERSIADLCALPVLEAEAVFAGLKLSGREAAIARDLLPEIRHRLAFLREVGLGYLSLDRAAPTLSGGEAQRIRLAAQLGSNLQGVCYILDEPTIGLHPRDNRLLLQTLARLAAKGNTLIVVEHDEDTIRAADHVIDLGPGAGTRGGEVVGEGDARALMGNPASLTGALLARPLRHPLAPRRAVGRDTPRLHVAQAALHNLRHLEVSFPLRRLVVITGVSGSGKSTLAREVLHDNLALRLAAERKKKAMPWLGCAEIVGWEALSRVLEVDQTPIGKTPRSCPATYVGFWDDIRRLFADTQEARLRGYTASRFSFNVGGKPAAKHGAKGVGGGRCPACEGQGVQKVEMSFLPDVKVPCEVCRGQRFDAETLAVTWKGKNIGEVLALCVDDALAFFSAHPKIQHALQILQDVGLGYLTLGQASPTLSGGEAQRLKLVTELAKARPARDRPGARGAALRQGHTLYVLDEPTVGLHLADVEKLLRALHRLVDAGNSVVLVEHHLDVMADADWIIDLGPEGGAAGGRLVAQGPPEKVAKVRASHTGAALKPFLAERSQ